MRNLVIRPLLAVIVAAAVSLTAGVADPSTAHAAAAPTVFGVYAGSGQGAAIQRLGSQLGRQPTYAMEFTDGSSWETISDPWWQLQQWSGTSYRMIWGASILPSSGASLAIGATGAYDHYFVTLAQNMVAAGQGDAIIRLAWEFNGDWFPWAAAGQAPAFIAYWQHIVTAMRSVPGANFAFEWNPTRGTSLNLADYYPGNSYVDIIGLDVYDTEWASYPGAVREFAAMETQQNGLQWMADFAAAQGKPMAFPEWGLGWGPSSSVSGPVVANGTEVSGGDDPVFIHLMAAWIRSHNVAEATFWDYGTSSVSDGQNPLTLAALQAEFGQLGSPVSAREILVAPRALLPEAPVTIAFPLLALAVFAGWAAVRRRRDPRAST